MYRHPGGGGGEGGGGGSIPFGEFATPSNGSTVRGSIAVSGWALDDVGVESVKIYRLEDNTPIHLGDAVFVEGARPDVEKAYPGYPFNHRAGWGYMLLTNFLPDKGNGVFVLQAVATDSDGNRVVLGEKTIICDNKNAVKPFGAIDAPDQGGIASGSNYRNQGWVLTPMPNSISTDGSTIDVYIDGIKLGHPVYNVYREDVARFFPGYANSNGALAYFDFDTTDFKDGVHSIHWVVTDSDGNTDGIGSRYFSIQNTGTSRLSSQNETLRNVNRLYHDHWYPHSELSPMMDQEFILVKKGFSRSTGFREVNGDENGIFRIGLAGTERLAVNLAVRDATVIEAYAIVGDQLQSLPIGSTLDRDKGEFTWIPGPAFQGQYHFVFIVQKDDGSLYKRDIIVRIGGWQPHQGFTS